VAQADAPTLLCARREMQSWLQLQLEPTALRQPSTFNTAPRLQPNGDGLAATLVRIARGSKEPEAVYARIANRLADLVRDVRSIGVERNDHLELLTLLLTDREGTQHAARSLSDGTLRFLALTVLEMDPEAHGVLCLEEPENGIHPDRISSMLGLLQDIAFDPEMALGPDNPLRQVVVNTHSPLVVAECPDDSLILAHPVEDVRESRVFSKVVFSGLDRTWRAKTASGQMAKGNLVAFLSPASLRPPAPQSQPDGKRHCRIRERQDLRQCFLAGFEGLKVAEE
jgi:predicted ATPase